MVYKCQEHNSYIVLKGLACADLAKKQTKNDFFCRIYFLIVLGICFGASLILALTLLSMMVKK